MHLAVDLIKTPSLSSFLIFEHIGMTEMHVPDIFILFNLLVL